jgi:hypothetical protein
MPPLVTSQASPVAVRADCAQSSEDSSLSSDSYAIADMHQSTMGVTMVMLAGMVAGRRQMSWGMTGNVVREEGLLEPRLMRTLERLQRSPVPVGGEETLNGVLSLSEMGLVVMRDTATGGNRWYITRAGEFVLRVATPGTVLMALGAREADELRELLRFGGWGELTPSLVKVQEQLSVND